MRFRPIPDNTTFGFMSLRRYSFPLSALLSMVSVLAFLVWGLNTGIDFRGGILVEVRAVGGLIDSASIREQLEDMQIGEIQLQEFGDGSDVSIRISNPKDSDEKAQQQIVERVKQTLGQGYEFRRTEIVGPRVSSELVRDGTLGTLIAIVGILIYLWFRFEWQFAVGAVIATLHDLVLTIGFFAIFQLDFDLTSVAAGLTIIGYSLNDTVVVFDRIRELMRKYKKIPIGELLDLAINSTLSRTIFTSVTTLLAMGALVVFGGQVLKSFALAMTFGIVIGTYSSIFIAAPILIYLGLTAQPSQTTETEK
jgi:preprotein translocase subunit SecF